MDNAAVVGGGHVSELNNGVVGAGGVSDVEMGEHSGGIAVVKDVGVIGVNESGKKRLTGGNGGGGGKPSSKKGKSGKNNV